MRKGVYASRGTFPAGVAQKAGSNMMETIKDNCTPWDRPATKQEVLTGLAHVRQIFQQRAILAAMQLPTDPSTPENVAEQPAE